MHISETLEFAVRHILPPMLIVTLIFLIAILVFPTFRLTFREFTLIYWSFVIVSFLLNYQAKRWTDYVVRHYGPQKEKNPVVRKMYIERNFKQYWIGWLGMYFILLFFYIIGVKVQIFLPSLILPSWVLAIVLYDFLNDFLWIRRLNQTRRPNHEPRESL